MKPLRYKTKKAIALTVILAGIWSAPSLCNRQQDFTMPDFENAQWYDVKNQKI